MTSDTRILTYDAHTLYAQWAAVPYTITYENAKGNHNPNPTTYTIEDEIIFTPLNDVTGYTFTGWDVAGITVGSTGAMTVTAQWTPIAYTITYVDTRDAINPNPTSYTIEDSITFTPLDDVMGYTFTGWDVAGIVFGSTGDMTVTAQWVKPYLSDMEDAEDTAPLLTTTAYDGFVYDADNTVRGTVTLKATMKEKKDKKTGVAMTNWTVSAKAVMQVASVSFSGKPVGALERFTAYTKGNAETLDVFMLGDRFYGTVSGGKVGGTFTVDGARAVFADKVKAAQDRLDEFRGLYNVALISDQWSVISGQREDVQGYVSLSVGNLGVVKYAGVLADGTKVSGSGKLLDGLSEETDNHPSLLAVALFRPLYSKKGFIGGLLWIDTDTQQVLVDTDYGWCVDWVCADPKKGGPFAYALDVLGGYFGNGTTAMPPPSGLRFNADCGRLAGTLALQWDGLAGGRWIEEAFPWNLPVIPNGLKPFIVKGAAPKLDKVAGAYDYEAVRNLNPSLAT
ncbi:MAG: hypothetical protein FWG50_10285, partial [Kiritimatiellaeota bacterium]|nr:hypothetical protein [Kiritimatiellota bacterium]